MKFRTGLLLTFVGLLAATFGIVVGAVDTLLEYNVRDEVRTQLERTGQVLQASDGYRHALFEMSARMVADEPRLKAVIGTEDVDPETVNGVLFDINQATQSDLLIATDVHGAQLGSATHAHAPALPQNLQDMVTAALSGRMTADLTLIDAAPYWVVARAVTFGDTVSGALLIGHAISNEAVEAVYQQTGAAVALVGADARVLVHAGMDPELMADLAARATQTAVTEIRSLQGERFFAVSLPLAGAPSQVRRYVVLRSLDQALAVGAKIRRLLWLTAGGALALALLLSSLFARSLSRPLEQITDFARAIGASDLRPRALGRGPHEVTQVMLAMNTMAQEIDASRRELIEKQKLEASMKIAADMQAAILPRVLHVMGLDIAVAMRPADNVGGDYYDVLPDPEHTHVWTAIGDVSGHGLSAGLIMLMLQSALSTSVRAQRGAGPKAVLGQVNDVLYENIHERLQGDDFITLTLMRWERDGRLTFAGGHEPMLLLRHGTRAVEVVETPGPWVGAMAGVQDTLEETQILLKGGDRLITHTDGITQAMNEQGEQFGLEQLCHLCEHQADAPAAALVDHIMAAVAQWRANRQFDDETLMVYTFVDQGPNRTNDAP